MTQKFFALILLILCLPVFAILYVLVKADSKGNFIFKQKREGYKKTPFTIYKIRTMCENAEVMKKNYLFLNQSNGPVFKIRNDPRYTKIGKIISHLGLDELPQLINIIKGDMVFIGPRPLPTNEASKIPERYKKRLAILPGITSLWIINGGHALSFEEWMELDLYYIKHRSWWLDLYILTKTIFLFISIVVNTITFQSGRGVYAILKKIQ
jgi:lipopolysaccharide/colanic/teichoic acid biosynthesis glycosyltransferase